MTTMVSDPGQHPAFKVDVHWEDFVEVHLLWPLWVQLALTLLFAAVLGPVYRWMASGPGLLQSFLKLYVGSRDRPEVPRPRCTVIICTLQMISSLVTVVVWARNTYTLSAPPVAGYITYATGTLDALYWLASRLRGEFSVFELWSLTGILDAVTIVPNVRGVYIDAPFATDWITLRFLRAYFILSSYQQIVDTGFFKHSNAMLQMAVLTTLRIYCLIIPMSGLLLTLEILGDPPVLADSFIETPGGDRLSFVMMVNWVIVSVVTLGSGAFYPKTVFAQWVWSVFIVAAVGYVFFIQFAFGQAWLATREGSGSYKPRQRRHIVVFLQVQGYGTQLSSVVLGLLGEALSTSCTDDWPDIVFFCESYWDASSATDSRTKTLQHFLRDRNFGSKARERVSFIVGQTCKKEDLERAAVADAALTYIIPDINTNTPERDDELNIFLALSLKRLYADVRLRLMLLLPQSKDLAVQSGIMMERCFSVREIKAHLLAQNVRCHGLLPMLTCFFKSVDEEQEAMLIGSRDKSHDSLSDGGSRARSPGLGAFLGDSFAEISAPDWVAEYVGGVSRGIVGFELSSEHSDLSFGELVATVYRGCGAVIVAVLIDGHIQVCPQETHWCPLPKGQVCFAIAPDEQTLDDFRDPDEERNHWRETLLATRDTLAKRTAMEGPHVAAARLLGKQLQEVVLRPEDELDGDDGDWGRQRSEDSTGSRGSETAASQAGTLMRSGGRKSSKMSAGGMSGVTGITGAYSVAMTSAEAKEEESMAAVDRVRRLRRQVGDTQDLVVVVVCQGAVWQQVRAFVSSLRARYQPVFRPIVILAPDEPPPRLLHGIKERVLTLVGSCLKVQQLVEAGVLEAGSVVVMAGEVPLEEMKRAPQLKDSRVVLCSRMLECWCGVSRKEVFTTYELLDGHSVSDLPRSMTKPAVDLGHFLADKAFDEDAKEEDEEVHDVGSRRSDRTSVSSARRASEGSSPDHAAKTSDNLLRSSQAAVSSITFNSRFAAGQVLTPEIWGCMLGRMYYNPAVIELAEALVMPQRRGQRAFPWQIRAPDFYLGKAYEELVIDLALGCWSNPNGSKRPEIGEHLTPKEGPVVAMALYRRRDEYFAGGDAAEGTGGNHYLVLGPPGGVRLQDGDWVLVLGGRRFGRKAMQLGLLRGSKPQSAAHAKDASPQDAVKAGQQLAAELAAEVAAEQAESNKAKKPSWQEPGVHQAADRGEQGEHSPARAEDGAWKCFAGPPDHAPGRPHDFGQWGGSAPMGTQPSRQDSQCGDSPGALSGLWQEVRQAVKSWGGLETLLDCPVGTDIPVMGYTATEYAPGGRPAAQHPGPWQAAPGPWPGHRDARADGGPSHYQFQPGCRSGEPEQGLAALAKGGPQDAPPPPPALWHGCIDQEASRPGPPKATRFEAQHGRPYHQD